MDAQYRARVILWAAMLFSIAMFAVVVKTVRPAAVTDAAGLVQVLMVLAVVLVATSFGVKVHFVNRARQTDNTAMIRTGELVAYTLCESAALFGVVAWFLAESPRWYWFVVLGAVGQLLHFPRRED